MSYNLLRNIIRKVIYENVLNQIRFHKISVTLFRSSTSTTTSLGDDYGGAGISGDAYQTPKDKMPVVNVTPVISASNPKLNEVFSEDEMYDFGLRREDSEYFICKEGILKSESESDGDCDGTWASFSLTIDSKNPEWNYIKEKIKPILTQADIDDAIKGIGKVKQFCKRANYTVGVGVGNGRDIVKKMKSDGQIQDYKVDTTSDNYGGYSEYYKIKINGKWGLATYRPDLSGKYDNLFVIIQPIFDKLNADLKKRTIEARKGDVVYNITLKNLRKTEITSKYSASEQIKKLKNLADRKSMSFEELLDNLDIKDDIAIFL